MVYRQIKVELVVHRQIEVELLVHSQIEVELVVHRQGGTRGVQTTGRDPARSAPTRD